MYIWAPTSVQRTAPSFPGCRMCGHLGSNQLERRAFKEQRLCFAQELMRLGGTWLNPGARRQGFGADGEERLFLELLREEVTGLPLVISQVR